MNKELIAILVLIGFALVGYVICKRWFRNTGSFDRVISGGLGRQLGLLGGIVAYMLAACFVAFAVASYPTINNELCFWDKIGAVFHRFFGYNYYEGEGTGLNWLLLLISIVGSLVMTGMLVTTFSNILQQRKENACKGEVYYKRIPQGHVVIIGYGWLVQPLLKRCLDEEGVPAVIILTAQPVEAVTRDIRSKLSPEQEKKVFVYSGDMHSGEHLDHLMFNQAKEVYILGEKEKAGRDAANLECARLICDKCEAVKTPLTVHVRLDRPTAYSTVKRLSFPSSYYQNKQGRTVIYLRPFNYYENSARAVWGYRPEKEIEKDQGAPRWEWPLLKEDDSRHVHLMIAGFGKMGKAMLLEAIRLCHFPNFNEKTGANKTHITVVDSAMDRLLPEFKAQYHELDKLSDIELDFRSVCLEDAGLRDEMVRLAQDSHVWLGVVICFSDPDRSLSAGINLPSPLYYSVDTGALRHTDNVRILIRQQARSDYGIDALLKENGEEENGKEKKYHNVRSFGRPSDGLAAYLFDDEMAMWAGAYYDFMWPDAAVYPEKAKIVEELRECYPVLKEKTILDFATMHYPEAYEAVRKLWYLTNEDLRFSNRYQVDVYGLYEQYEGSVEKKETLWRMEHLRWCADRLIAGYTPLPLTPEQKKAFEPAFSRVKPIYQLHNLLVPYEDLPQGEKDKDTTVIGNRKAIVALVRNHQEIKR